MLIETWTEKLTSSFQDMGTGLIEFVPSLVVAIIIFIVGWVVGSILGRIVSQFAKSLKVDNALRTAGLDEILGRAGFELNAGKFLGGLVKWFIITVFLVASLEVLGLNQVNVFLQEVVLLYLPQVIVAVLILLVAAVIAEVMQNIVIGAAKAVNMSSANFLGSVAKWSIWVFALLAALNQLGVATAFVQTLFTGIVVAVSLALGLSFGLGGQEAAGRYLNKIQDEIKTHNK